MGERGWALKRQRSKSDGRMPERPRIHILRSHPNLPELYGRGVVLRDKKGADATLYGGIALIAPLVLALIFVGVQWVVTGRLKASSAQTQ